MKNVGKLIVMLSLIAMAPSYAKKSGKADEVKQKGVSAQTVAPKSVSLNVDSSCFKGLENEIAFVDLANCYGEGDGSFFNPYSSIREAAQLAKPGVILYVIAHQEESYDYGAFLKPSQSLVSSGVALKLGDKTIPALTPGDLAIIEVPSDATGVFLTSCNQVAGFIFQPRLKSSNAKENFGGSTGIGYGFSIDGFSIEGEKRYTPFGVGGTNFICKNSFLGLTTGVNLALQGWSSVDISSNCFVSVEQGIVIRASDGDEAHICKNTFEDVSHECISCEGLSSSTMQGKNSRKASEATQNGEKIASGLSSSDAPQFFVEGNSMSGSDYSSASGFRSDGAKTVVFNHNTMSHLSAGFLITQRSSLLSTVRVEENVATDVDLSNLYLQNVWVSVKKNKLTGLYLETRGGTMANVEKNHFESSTSPGFSMIAFTGDCSPNCSNCLRLVENCAESATADDYLLTNNDSDPSVFRIEVRDPLSGFDSLQQANRGSITVPNPVDYVRKCDSCLSCD